jgi:hypothetical protein
MSTHSSWREAVAELRKITAGATSQQQKLATLVGIRLPKVLPKLIAAARLRVAIASELCSPSALRSSDGQLEFLATLNEKRARDSRVRADHYEAGAWIEFHIFKLRQEALERLRLEAGDIVQIKDSEGSRLWEVSSISSDGRVHFKGGQGAVAWPDVLSVRVRKGANTKKARTLRETAANQAAERRKTTALSHAKELELGEFKVTDPLTLNDVEQLQEVIDAANNEAPIQRFLEERPRILAALLGGHSQFSVARPQLGSELIPDFLLSDVDSLGIRWILVELETPISNVTLKNDNLLEKHARKGVSQIEEWREWIQNNLDKARRSRREGGLGLFDIRPRSEGLVLVGRRSRLLDNAKAVRHAIWESDHIRVHTYDWLTEKLRGVLRFQGPPASNPRLI